VADVTSETTGTSTLSDLARRLLDEHVHATVSSIEEDGSVQLSLVWVTRDGDDVLISTLAGRRKARNWTRDPRATVLLFDPEDAGRYAEIRGRVSIVDDPGGSLIHELAHAYDDEPFTGIIEGRVIVRVAPERVVTR
jgi:PPOX class probable F420-dependent enzyme